MTIETFLNDPVNSYLIYIPGKNTDVMIGVPHHAPLGIQHLPCESHPTSDENTGFIGYRLAQLLDCPCLIAGNYFIDPNKYKSSDYFKKIEEVSPKFLIEIILILKSPLVRWISPLYLRKLLTSYPLHFRGTQRYVTTPSVAILFRFTSEPPSP